MLNESDGTWGLRQQSNTWPFSISVVIPARDEGYGIREVISRIRRELPEAEILVVDDGSNDDTADQATQGGARVIRHPYSIGNGAGVKTGIRHATGDIVLVLDADGQHDPADIPLILQPLTQGYVMVVGARRHDTHASLLRRLGNSALNHLATYLVDREIHDLTSGFRAMKRERILEFLSLMPNQYSWPTTSLLAFIKAGYPVQFISIAAKRRIGGRSRQQLLRNGLRFGVIILRVIMLFNPLRVFTPISLFFLLLSIVFYALSVFASGIWLHLPPASVTFAINAVLVFMLGLIAEQIAALRSGLTQTEAVQRSAEKERRNTLD